MKINLPALSAIILGVMALTACSTHTVYWKLTDPGTALYLKGPVAQQKLNQDIAYCTQQIKKDVGNDKLREALPPDTANGGGKGNLDYYGSPLQVGEKGVTTPTYHDFDGCMRTQGWARQAFVRPQTIVTARKDYKEAQSIDKTGMTIAAKQQTDAEALAHRQENLVPMGVSKTFGVQTFHDDYKEPSLSVHTKTQYYGITGSYTYRWYNHTFVSLQGRIARGNADYASPDGTINGIPDYEGDVRLMYGQDDRLQSGNWFSPYFGLGLRIFRDLGKGYYTNLGYYAYDRRIRQLYLPIGATWSVLAFGHMPVYTTFEADPLLIGNVNSRLTDGGGPNVVNTQNPFSGVGLRGRILFGIPLGHNNELQIGPFVRYWYIRQSTMKIILPKEYYEPTNKRLQVGVTAQIRF